MKVLYAKTCAERRPEYRQVTLIVEENGRRSARKQALGPAARAHVNAYAENGERLQQALQPDSAIRILDCVRIDDGVVAFPYLEEETLAERMHGLGPEAYAQELLAFREALIKAFGTVPFRMTRGYRAMFGDEALAEGRPCLRVTNLDMNLDNVFLHGDGSRTLIDCEWVVDFPVPVDYVLFRALPPETVFSGFDEAGKRLVRERLGLTDSDWETCWEMERAFQRMVAREEDKLDYYLGKGRIAGAAVREMNPDGYEQALAELAETRRQLDQAREGYLHLSRRWFVRAMRKLGLEEAERT